MPTETKSSKTMQGRIDLKDEVMTREKLVPLFDDIKELIVSTAKGTEAVLGKRIDRVEEELQLTQKALRATKDELNTKIEGVETRLRGEMQEMKDELRGEMQEMKDELRGEIRASEGRLTDTIESNAGRIDNLDTRVSSLENART